MIQPISVNQASEVKQLRLIGLKTDSTSFAASFDQEKDYSLSYYQQKILTSNSDDGFGYWGYFESNQLIGYALLSQEKLFHSNHLAFIYELIIHPDFRGQGKGKELMTKLISIVSENPQIKQLHLKCSSLNTTAQKLYTSLGFTKFAIRQNSLFYQDIGYADEYWYFLEV